MMETTLPNPVSQRRNLGLTVPALCILVSCAAVVPFFFVAEKPAGAGLFALRIPVTHDLYLHFDQMRSFYEGLLAGEIYPRWERDVNRGFGAPTFSFYPPGVYYLTSFFFALGCEPTGAVLGAVLLMAAASAIAFYLYAGRTLSSRAALVGMLAYVIWPYHLLDLYQRGAIAEMTAFIWMPLMMYFADGLIDLDESGGRRYPDVRMMAGLAAAYAAFLWSHPPTAYQFTIIFGAYALTRCAMERRFIVLAGVILGLVIGVALAAAYILPAVADLRLVRGDVIQSQFPYHQGYVFGDPARYGDSAAQFMQEIDLLWWFGAVAIIFGATALWMRSRMGETSRQRRSLIAGWIVAGVAASYLMTPYSRALCQAVPWIEFGVFPWRLLSVTTLVGSLIAGALVFKPQPTRAQRRGLFSEPSLRFLRLPGELLSGLRRIAAEDGLPAKVRSSKRRFASSKSRLQFANVLAPLVATAIISGALILGLDLVLAYRGSPAFSPRDEHLNYAVLPRSAYGDLERLPRVERTVLAGGRGTIEVERWDPGRRTLRVQALAPEKLLIRTFNFPGWTATVDGYETEIIPGRPIENSAPGDARSDAPPDGSGAVQSRRQNGLGDIGILLSPGDHLVSLEYRATSIQKVGTILTLLSSLVTLTMFLTPKRLLRRRSR